MEGLLLPPSREGLGEGDHRPSIVSFLEFHRLVPIEAEIEEIETLILASAHPLHPLDQVSIVDEPIKGGRPDIVIARG